MIIRDYKPADFPQIEALWKETGIYTIERGDTAPIIESCNQKGGKLLVMEDPGTGNVAGTSWITHDGRRIHLHHFAIRASLQGKGHGRKLALASLEFARDQACPLKLEVHAENLPAINLYKSLGFEVFENYNIYMILDPGSALDRLAGQ
ncbi:MAG: GNAT family N-acetyltransferase [Bacteroidales bacterium]|nr:GNAT family N-acetyltransferase [Bacteroidales bacterium]